MSQRRDSSSLRLQPICKSFDTFFWCPIMPGKDGTGTTDGRSSSSCAAVTCAVTAQFAIVPFPNHPTLLYILNILHNTQPAQEETGHGLILCNRELLHELQGHVHESPREKAIRAWRAAQSFAARLVEGLPALPGLAWG